jgi:hypothetical protein
VKAKQLFGAAHHCLNMEMKRNNYTALLEFFPLERSLFCTFSYSTLI